MIPVKSWIIVPMPDSILNDEDIPAVYAFPVESFDGFYCSRIGRYCNQSMAFNFIRLAIFLRQN